MERSKSRRSENSGKSPPKFIPREIDDDMENLSPKINVSPIGRLRKSTMTSMRSTEINLNETLNLGCDKCEKCVICRDNISKAVNHIRSYVDNINDRLNLTYHKTGQMRKNSSEIENALSPEYYHAIFYSELDKYKMGNEMVNQFRFLMKSLRLFNDKFDYIVRKHENFEKMAHEYKNFKLSNKFEDMSQLTENEINEVKSLSEHSIFKNFNMARDNFESCLKDLKSSLNTVNDRSSNVNENNKMIESFEVNSDSKNSDVPIKDTYLKNELTRMVKENTSLRLELNYIYEKLRDENKIYEIKEDIIIKKSNSIKDNNGSNNNFDNMGTINNTRARPSKSMNYSSTFTNNNSNNFANSLVVFKVKNEKKDEDYWIAKNYIKMLRQSEFYMI